ncbi:MAG: type II toxin-antitoxin system HipA family toxin [Vicinamibacterales bacterium]
MVIAEVRLWGSTIGAVAMVDGRDHAAFEFTPEFSRSGIEVAPLMMPLGSLVYEFPTLPRAAFHGLPGMLADSLPDRFGNALIDAWLATQGRAPASFTPVERLCYTGSRGMGALEYRPALGPRAGQSTPVDVEALVQLASDVLTRHEIAGGRLDDDDSNGLTDILAVGTSAGGARAKAVIAWNPQTHEVRSGQVAAGEGFQYWLLKFDGVAGNRDKELDDPQGYGVIEYAYSLMAEAAGLTMTECRLLEEHGRRHFMTRRFDRDAAGRKLHMASLGALAHFDYNQPGAYGYEQAFQVMRTLGLPMSALEEQFRRMVFNIVGRNQDDHVKNIAFLMDKAGTWSLAPAFDVTYSYNPAGAWTSAHQMTVNGKRDGFTRDDLRAVAQVAGLKRGRADAIADEVTAAVRRWPEFAAAAGLGEEVTAAIGNAHRVIAARG